MKNDARRTMRSMARALGLSRTTVSDSLRNHPRVNAATRTRVHAYAAEIGYRFNPLASSILSEVRRTRWAAALLADVTLNKGFEHVKPLVIPQLGPELFRKWFDRHRPDVVLGHRLEIVSWMKDCGARVPETHGFCCLNVSINATPCAGIDQQPYQIGVRGIEIIIGQLHRNDYGIPELPLQHHRAFTMDRRPDFAGFGHHSNTHSRSRRRHEVVSPAAHAATLMAQSAISAAARRRTVAAAAAGSQRMTAIAESRNRLRHPAYLLRNT